MAKQKGILRFTGTMQNLTGYEMNGQFYVKTKSEISRKKMRTHPCFANTRRAQEYFSRAQRLAKLVYRHFMRPEDRKLPIWYRLRNRAQELLRTDMPYGQAENILLQEFVPQPQPKTVKKPVPVPEPFIETKMTVDTGTLKLGRAFGRIDPSTRLLDQLAAINGMMQHLLDNSGMKVLRMPKKFRETVRSRRE